MVVQLDTFYAAESTVVSDIRDLTTVGEIDLGLRFPVSPVRSDPDDEFEIISSCSTSTRPVGHRR